jgi:hypothetical protein
MKTSAMHEVRGLVCGLLLAGLAPAPPVAAQATEAPPRPFLRKVIQLDEAQLAAVDRGDVVTKLLPTQSPEIAAFGVVRVNVATVDALLKSARDVRTFKMVPQIPEMGTFSTPPKEADLAGLNLPEADVAALKSCKPGKCDVKLAESAIQQLAAINWSAPDASKNATRLMNARILEMLTAYQKGGTDVMTTVVDKKDPRARALEYKTVLSNSPYLATYVKEFDEYLRSFPKGKLEGAEDVFYWTKDTFGLKPVVSFYHMTLYKDARGALIATKLLAASHYFNAALEVLAGVPTPDGKGLYLLDLYRTRIDPPTGMLSGVLMGKVRSGIETGVQENLKQARTRLAGK